MPRAPSATKRQQGAANHRDTRHENGLVGPGRRVQRQKSNGHLNGHVKSSESLPPTPPLPATPPPATNGHVPQPGPADNISDSKMPVNGVRRASVSGYSEETSSSESYNNMPAISVSNENHRRIDVNAAKNPAVHRDVGPLSLALTVLRSCPLYDTIAILIVLLQIPPTFLSIIHILFATLTFVPPSTSTTSGISFSDIFEGTMGTPSLATIVFVDIAVLLIWLFLWSPLQEIALDLAQTVIALTLGGGTSGKEAGMNNVLVCFGIIGFSHLVRNGNVKQSGLRAFISSSTSGLLGTPDPDDPLEPVSQGVTKKGAHGWVRSILAIHILTQGVVRYIRDWYVRREKRDSSALLGDPEAGKTLTDTSSDTTSTQTPDNESLSSNSVSSKKKRKQSAQVRIRQPLWAALASTKIVMVKEYETSHTAAESAGTNATDINNLGNAPFNTEADRIWVTYVGSDEVFFATSYFPTHTIPESCEEKKDFDSSGVDKSKPFFVRVNKTIWQPTKIYTVTDPDQPAGQDIRWGGEIFGLAPMSSYECDFVSTIDGALIFSTSVRTIQPPMDIAAIGLAPGPVVTGRPGSPTTTLKTSIASAEVKLAEERNRSKRERKDQRAKLNSLRKEIEKLAGGIASSGGNDDRLRQKVQQSNLHMKQAEDAIVSLASQIETLSSLPTDADTMEMKAAKAQYQSHRDIHNQARKEFTAAKQAAESEVQTLANDVTNLEAKRERIQFRIAKLTSEHERITDANARGLDEAQRKFTEQQAREVERQNLETHYTGRLFAITTEFQQKTYELSQLQAHVAQLQAMEQAEMVYTQSPTASVPNLGYGDIPEGATTSHYPWNPAPSTAGLYTPGYPMMASGSTQGIRTRGRSSSMLSNVSGFTQSSGEGDVPQQQMQSSLSKFALPNMYIRDRQGSSGSASMSGSGGSRSGNGSVGDPKSPIVGNGKAKWGSGSGSTRAGGADEK
jgi:hypothetical protein